MTVCDRCFKDASIGEHGRFLCPYEARSSHTVVGDDIPGGQLVFHGLCNPDGSPRRYDTKSEMAAEAKRRGLESFVRHVEGSKKTSRWV